MTVQDRCGQSNDLSPVLHFLSAYESRQVNCRLSLADKMRVKFKEDLSNAEDAKGNK